MDQQLTMLRTFLGARLSSPKPPSDRMRHTSVDVISFAARGSALPLKASWLNAL
jgi:hypothetical protein